jgi:Domain of unknown function (DUF4270)
VKKRYIAFSLIAIIATVAIIFSGCKKLNESTDLGGGLIPPVDNINTFDTSITVLTYNDTLKFMYDSIRIGTNEEFFLGKINNDPFFGKTDARLFLELKPPSYPFTFLNKPTPDSLKIDSVVLVLDYAETYGDSITPQTINVYEVNQSSNFTPDSAYLIRTNNFTYSNLLGTKTVAPERLKDSVKVRYDTTSHQLRIKLNNTFGERLLFYDSTSNLITGAYANDSVFRSKFKGFALQSMSSGGSIMGFDLAGGFTKLAIYYKYDKRVTSTVPNFKDTVAYFTFKTGLTGVNSAAANYVIRDYSGTPALASLNNGTAPDPVLYLQNTPGTYASLKIPDLGLINNRVIHRAELYMEQIYDYSDSLYRSPDFLYLDAVDPTITANPKMFRTIPYDLNFGSNSSSLDYTSFGVVPVMSTDLFGNRIRTWKFNITRYVQHVLTQTQSLYELRLFPAFRFYEQLGIPPATDFPTPIYINSTIAKGRIRLGGNTGPLDTNPGRMKLRLIYSKL